VAKIQFISIKRYAKQYETPISSYFRPYKGGGWAEIHMGFIATEVVGVNARRVGAQTRGGLVGEREGDLGTLHIAGVSRKHKWP
jgi:hypothetical protein